MVHAEIFLTIVEIIKNSVIVQISGTFASKHRVNKNTISKTFKSELDENLDTNYITPKNYQNWEGRYYDGQKCIVLSNK